MATTNLEKTRLRKTPMGKVGLKNFLAEHGHPAPWAENDPGEAGVKRPLDESDGGPKPMKVMKKAMKKAMKVSFADSGDDAQKKSKKAPNTVIAVTDQSDEDPSTAPKGQSPMKGARKSALKPSKKAPCGSTPMKSDQKATTKSPSVSPSTAEKKKKGTCNKAVAGAAQHLGLKSAVGISDVAAERLQQMHARLAQQDSDSELS